MSCRYKSTCIERKTKEKKWKWIKKIKWKWIKKNNMKMNKKNKMKMNKIKKSFYWVLNVLLLACQQIPDIFCYSLNTFHLSLF